MKRDHCIAKRHRRLTGKEHCSIRIYNLDFIAKLPLSITLIRKDELRVKDFIFNFIERKHFSEKYSSRKYLQPG